MLVAAPVFRLSLSDFCFIIRRREYLVHALNELQHMFDAHPLHVQIAPVFFYKNKNHFFTCAFGAGFHSDLFTIKDEALGCGIRQCGAGTSVGGA